MELQESPKPNDKRFIDLTGVRRDAVEVLAYAGQFGRQKMWWCKCDCGTVWKVAGTSLHREPGTRSCGCLSRSLISQANSTHRMIHTPEYAIWRGILARCLNKNNKHYHDYGGRGIRVCDEWVDSFEAFYAAVGPRPNRSDQLDRHPNNDGNYEPGNVRWATRIEQARNKRNNLWITCRGETRCLAEWAEITGLHRCVIRHRLRVGWTIDDALSLPIKQGARGRASAS
jgi:hypothetical protein